MKLFISLLILSALGHSLWAQHDFQKGFIITLKQDTLHGFIDNKNARNISKTCVFKSAEDAKPQKYAPEELRGFRFSNGKYFVSRKTEDADQINHLFLEYLVDGVVEFAGRRVNIRANQS